MLGCAMWCVCLCMFVWDVVIDDTVYSNSIVENTAGSDGVVVVDDVVEGTAVSSSIVRIQLAVMVLWLGCCR